jgi:hypothetical protein
MGSLVELSRIAKSDPYAMPSTQRNVPGQKAATGAGVVTAGAGGLLALSSRNLPAKAAQASRNAWDAHTAAEARAAAFPKSKTARKTADAALDRAKLANVMRYNAPARAAWMRRTGGKAALVGGGLMAAGYGIKRMNDGS